MLGRRVNISMRCFDRSLLDVRSGFEYPFRRGGREGEVVGRGCHNCGVLLFSSLWVFIFPTNFFNVFFVIFTTAVAGVVSDAVTSEVDTEFPFSS